MLKSMRKILHCWLFLSLSLKFPYFDFFFFPITVEWPELWPERYAIDLHTAKINDYCALCADFCTSKLIKLSANRASRDSEIYLFISYNIIKNFEHFGFLCIIKWLTSEKCRSDTLISSHHLLNDEQCRSFIFLKFLLSKLMHRLFFF